MTVGLNKRFNGTYQYQVYYTWSRDLSDDDNERDPFTDRSFNFFDLSKDWGPSDRDIRHKANFFGFFDLTHGLSMNARMQYRGAQPITANPRVLNGEDRGRNNERKDNEFFTFDWRLIYTYRFANGTQIIPMLEMFNTFNNDNNINPLSTPALFDFSGYLRTGVGDPRQAQLAVKVVF